MSSESNEPVITIVAKGKSGLDNSYRMIRLLGRGTMSSVYLAEQLSMARPVALKILSPALAAEPAFVERFLREARASARLNHPNIVAAIDFGEVDNRYYLTMEYVDGETLASLIAREAPLFEERVVAIGRQVILALEHAAQHNVIHRDVKPANIMISREGRVKLTDFGLAILADHPGMAEASRRAVGTPYYMAPEQLEGRIIDWRADQCSLGASLYEAATGSKPFSGKSVSDVLTRRLTENPVPAWRVNRRVSRNFSSVLAKMLARSPGDRYQSFADLKEDFDRLASGRGPNSVSPSAHPHAAGGSRGRRSVTVERGKVKALSGKGAWDIVLIVSGAVIALLAAYAAVHWEELAGPRPESGAAVRASTETPVSFAKYREMRDAWAAALRLRLEAENTPTPEKRELARLAYRRLRDNPAYAGTVYASMAAIGLAEMEKEAQTAEAEAAP